MSLPLDPEVLARPVVGAVLSVSAQTVSVFAVTGVAAVLSTNASASVSSTTTAIPAPEPEPVVEESAVDVMFVFTLAFSATSPVEAAITLVPESCVFPVARTNAATTDESFCSAFVQFPSSPVSLDGCVELGLMALVAAYFLPSVSVTTSPFA